MSDEKYRAGVVEGLKRAIEIVRLVFDETAGNTVDVHGATVEALNQELTHVEKAERLAEPW